MMVIFEFQYVFYKILMPPHKKKDEKLNSILTNEYSEAQESLLVILG